MPKLLTHDGNDLDLVDQQRQALRAVLGDLSRALENTRWFLEWTNSQGRALEELLDEFNDFKRALGEQMCRQMEEA
jgi:ABC-type transporter Mla subunit MlaD